MSRGKLVERAAEIIARRGKKAVETAEKEILRKDYAGGIVNEALQHFAEVTMHGALPSFPALISLSCEAVGGKTERTVSMGAAITLMAAAADVHDDIIDQSKTKNLNLTVFGRFGKDIALLTGDTLLFIGQMLLHRTCESLSKDMKNAILKETSKAFFEASNAEAIEMKLKKEPKLRPQDYLEMIWTKAAVSETNTRIGAILGNGKKNEIETLGHYGRTFGVLSLVRDEFIDLFEYQELQNRIVNECPPFPLLLVLQDTKTRTQLAPLLEDLKLTEEKANIIAQIVSEAKQVQKFRKEMDQLIKNEIKNLAFIQNRELLFEIKLLLKASTDGI